MYDVSKSKITITRDTVEIRRYEKLNLTGKKKENTEKKERTEEESIYHYNWRQKNKAKTIQNIISINFENDKSIFVTVTFAKEPESVEEANKFLKKFLRIMRKRYSDLLYLAILEKGSYVEVGGRFHYHIIFNIEYSEIAEDDIRQAWKWGSEINVQRTYDLAKLARYMTKGFEKVEPEFYNKKRYLSSEGMQKEKIIKAWDDPDAAYQVEEKLTKEDFLSGFRFENDRSGEVQVLLYAKDLNVFQRYKYATRNE